MLEPNEVAERCRQTRGDLELAQLVADELLDFFVPEYITVAIPELLKAYRDEESEENRYEFNKNNPKWLQRPDIKKFLEHESSVISHNESDVHWLNEWEKILGDDLMRTGKIKEKLKEYEYSPKTHKYYVRNVVKMERPPKEAVQVAEMFSGVVTKDGGWNEEEN